jgi:hypothetical protein
MFLVTFLVFFAEVKGIGNLGVVVIIMKFSYKNMKSGIANRAQSKVQVIYGSAENVLGRRD